MAVQKSRRARSTRGMRRSHDKLTSATLSIDVETWASADRPRFRENTLFTHRGLSGPSILQISSVLKPRESFRINLLPGVDAKAFLMSHRMGGKDLKWALRQVLPERFGGDQDWNS